MISDRTILGRDLGWPDCLRVAIDELSRRRREKVTATIRLVSQHIGAAYQSVRHWYTSGRPPRDAARQEALIRFFGWGPEQLLIGDGEITIPDAPKPCTHENQHRGGYSDDPVRSSRIRRYAEAVTAGRDLFEVQP